MNIAERIKNLDQTRKALLGVSLALAVMFLISALIISNLVTQNLAPDDSRASSAECRKLGINLAAVTPGSNGSYEQARKFGMGYTLEIVMNPGQLSTVADSFKRAQAAGLTPLLRVCIGQGCAFSDPATYVDFIAALSGQVSGEFYAIAGPNEPEGENWTGGERGNGASIGGPLAAYMNAVIAGVKGRNLPNVKLMSPVFNATHPEHEALVGSMNAAGAKWDGLDAIGVNAYNVQGYNIRGRSLQTVTEQLGRIKSTLPGRKYFITETGLYESERNADPIKSTPDVPHVQAVANMAREAEQLRQDGSVIAFLMFNGFATNPDPNFQYNKLTSGEWSQIRGAGCGGTITGPDLPPANGGDGGTGGNDGGSAGNGSCIFPEFLLRIAWEGSSGLVDPSGGGLSLPAGTKLNLYVFSSSSGDLARNVINDAVLVYKGAGLDGRRALGVGGMILTPRDPGELSVTTGNYQECGVKSFKIAVTRTTGSGQNPPVTPPVTPPTTPPTTPPATRPPSVTPPAVRPPAVTPPPVRPTSPVLPETSLPGPTVLLLIASAVLIALAGIITRKYLFKGGKVEP